MIEEKIDFKEVWKPVDKVIRYCKVEYYGALTIGSQFGLLKKEIRKLQEENKCYQKAIKNIKKTARDYREGKILDIQDSFFVDEVIAIINNLEGDEQ